MRVSVAEVERKLAGLHNQYVVYYDKRKDKPQITFTTPRYDASKLHLDIRYLEERRHIDLEKAGSVIDYVTREQTCRSVVLQNYFGESTAHDCGICDYCIKKSRPGGRADHDENIRQSLFDLMLSGGKPVAEILENVPELEKDRWLEVIKELLESEELYYDENGSLHLAGVKKR